LNGNSREPKIDVGWVHLVNTLWIDEDSHSYYGIRAIAEGDVLPEVLVEGAYVENFDKIYYHEEGGLIAEEFCNVDEFSRDRASTPRAKADLSWCAPYDYYRMDPFDCHEVARVRANAGAVVGTTGAPSASPAPSAAPSRAPSYAPTAPPTRYAPSPGPSTYAPTGFAAPSRPPSAPPTVAAAPWHKRGAPSKDCAWVAAYAPRCAAVGDDGSLAADACGACGGSVAPTLQASAPPSGAPSAAPSAPPSTARPTSARPSAAPTAPPDAAVRVGGSARAIHAGRMGLYVFAGEECGGRPFYDCADCPSHSALYYDDGLGYWFVGPNGCGSLTVAMYAVDGARSPDRVAVAWREWDGAGWAASDGAVTAVGPAPTRAPSASTPPSLAPSAAPSLSPRPSGLPTLLPAPAPTTAAPAPAPTTAAPSPAPSTAAPSAAPCGAVAVAGSDRSIHASRMGVYVSRGDACAGRPFYECLDCAGASALYYDDELAYWFVGPNGCGSLTVAMYVVDAARSPDLAAAAWREWDGSGWSLSNATLSCLGPAPTLAPSAAPTPAPSTAAPTLSVAPTSPAPSTAPSFGPSVLPAPLPTTAAPSAAPAPAPSAAPSPAPSAAPSPAPSAAPVPAPSAAPAPAPSAAPAPAPSAAPVPAPSAAPVPVPSAAPAPAPSTAPVPAPSAAPSAAPAPAPSRAPSAAPAPRPTPAPAPRPTGGSCEDSASWYQAGKPSRGCAYVAGKASRCSKEDADGVSAADACERACGRCDAPATCEDSVSWYAKKAKKDCDYVAEQPEKRCGKKGLDAIRAIDACPAACGACDDACADSASWYSKKSKKDCAYVAADPGKRCSKKGQGSIRAEDACPAACGACETPAPSSAAVDAACADSSSWTEAGRPSRGCAYVADKPSEKRCGKEDESGVLASSACAAACGACGPPPVSPFS